MCRVTAIDRDGREILVGNLIHGTSTASRDGETGGPWSKVRPFHDTPVTENASGDEVHWYVGRLDLPTPTPLSEMRLTYLKEVGLIEIADIVLIPPE
jgi:hypothetical protein